MKDFKDKVVAITGGATGIGFSFAKRFGAEGAKLALCGLHRDRLDEAAAELTSMGIDVKAKVCDVARQEEVEAFADFAWEEFGRVDVIMNNAGIMVQHAPVLDMPVEDIKRIFDVNFFGVVHGSKVFGRRFVEQRTPAALP